MNDYEYLTQFTKGVTDWKELARYEALEKLWLDKHNRIAVRNQYIIQDMASIQQNGLTIYSRKT